MWGWNVGEAIKQAKEGECTFRVDTGKNIHVPLGKVSF
jgi:ribosomal protein L1